MTAVSVGQRFGVLDIDSSNTINSFREKDDVDGSRTVLAGMKMPVKYVAEMFCDRIAASRIYNKEKYKDSDPLDYYIKGLGHYIMHPETDALLHKLLQMLADKGEEYTFEYNVLKK